MGKPFRIVLLGPPNSGKGTQAERLAETLGIPSISTGEMLRAAVATGSELGKRAGEVMAKGELVDDELMAEIVSDRLAEADAQQGFILDGYPRTAPQAETLAAILERLETRLDAVLLVDADEDVLIARALGRGRSDDSEDVMRERLRVYRAKTAPLIEHYDRLGVLRSIDGNHSIEEVGRRIESALGIAGG